MTSPRTATLGPAARPVSIPEGIDTAEKARGVVELPAHIRWSGPAKNYDLARTQDRLLVYEQVLSEGTDEDVSHFIEVEELIALWDQLFLPKHVRHRWSAWLKKNRNIDLP